MSGTTTSVRVKRAPSGRQWTMVSQGATKEPCWMAPTRAPTVIDVPRETRTSHARLPASACTATTAHQAMSASTTTPGNGTASSRHAVAAAASTMNAASLREGANAKATLASLYLFASMSELVTDLSHNALLGVTGDDAAAFLHGQFTNDVEALAEGAAQWNGWCTPKGRLLATFLLIRHKGGFLILLPAEIAAAFLKRLSMFVLRSKVKIRDVSGEYARRGILGRGAHPQPMRVEERDGALVVALDGERILMLGPPASAPAANTPADAWELASIRAGVPTITAATQEAFVPQMANFDLVGGVSFKKGCYPGQEIVARTQYRGGLKRRMALAHIAGRERPQPGESVYSGAFGDQSAGTIVNAAPAPGGGFDALVVAQIESLERGDLRWKSPDGLPVEVVSHPSLAA